MFFYLIYWLVLSRYFCTMTAHVKYIRIGEFLGRDPITTGHKECHLSPGRQFCSWFRWRECFSSAHKHLLVLRHNLSTKSSSNNLLSLAEDSLGPSESRPVHKGNFAYFFIEKPLGSSLFQTHLKLLVHTHRSCWWQRTSGNDPT